MHNMQCFVGTHSAGNRAEFWGNHPRFLAFGLVVGGGCGVGEIVAWMVWIVGSGGEWQTRDRNRLATQLRVELVAGPTHSCLDSPSVGMRDAIGEATLSRSDSIRLEQR